jgi:hypothetical protein
MTGFYSKDFILESAYGQFFFSGDEYHSSVRVIDEYNAFLNSNNPPFLNERV